MHAARAGKLGEVDDGDADAKVYGQGSSPRTRRSEASLSLARLARQQDKGPTTDAPNTEPCQRNVDLGRADPAPRVDQLAAKVARTVWVEAFEKKGVSVAAMCRGSKLYSWAARGTGAGLTSESARRTCCPRLFNHLLPLADAWDGCER